MKMPTVTTKIEPSALRKLRAIAALTSEKQYGVLTRLIEDEFARHDSRVKERAKQALIDLGVAQYAIKKIGSDNDAT